MWFAVARWTSLCAIYLMTGALALRAVLLRRVATGAKVPRALVAELDRLANRAGAWAAVLLTGANLARGYLQVRSFVDPGEPLTRDAVRAVITDSTWGHGWLSQVVASTAAVLLWAASRRGGLGLAATATLAALITAPLTGHAVTDAAGRFGWVVDAVHLAAGAVWLGTLAVIALVAFPILRREPATRGRAVALVIGAFSPLALGAVGVAVLAGLLMGWRYLNHDLSALTATSYGRALGLKLVAFAGVATAGAYNWRVIKPLLGDLEGAERLTKTARVELLLGLSLLAITAVLVALPMPAESQ